MASEVSGKGSGKINGIATAGVNRMTERGKDDRREQMMMNGHASDS